MCGVRVDVFSLGFGPQAPRLAARRRRSTRSRSAARRLREDGGRGAAAAGASPAPDELAREVGRPALLHLFGRRADERRLRPGRLPARSSATACRSSQPVHRRACARARPPGRRAIEPGSRVLSVNGNRVLRVSCTSRTRSRSARPTRPCSSSRSGRERAARDRADAQVRRRPRLQHDRRRAALHPDGCKSPRARPPRAPVCARGDRLLVRGGRSARAAARGAAESCDAGRRDPAPLGRARRPERSRAWSSPRWSRARASRSSASRRRTTASSALRTDNADLAPARPGDRRSADPRERPPPPARRRPGTGAGSSTERVRRDRPPRAHRDRALGARARRARALGARATTSRSAPDRETTEVVVLASSAAEAAGLRTATACSPSTGRPSRSGTTCAS